MFILSFSKLNTGTNTQGRKTSIAARVAVLGIEQVSLASSALRVQAMRQASYWQCDMSFNQLVRKPALPHVLGVA